MISNNHKDKSQAEQQKFYSDISQAYSNLFPFNQAQFHFVGKTLGSFAEKRILDLGCGTGDLSLRMAEEGAWVEAIDLNVDFIEMAKSKNNHPAINYREMDMLDIGKPFPPGFFDCVTCFGNTLVHLTSLAQISELIKLVYGLLKEGGWLLIQILNYDYILGEKVGELPLIETSHEKFIRRYFFPENERHIRFNTELIFKNTGESVVNETTLLPVKKNELVDLLQLNRFTSIGLFADFNRNPAGGGHLPLVVSCRKG